MSDERAAFEAWIAAPPYEVDVIRFSHDPADSAWPGQYWFHEVQLAWEAWNRRADLAGLPEELVERIRTLEKNVMFTAGYRQDTIWLMRAILAWHEQKTGGGE